MRYLSLFI